jgi:hypothetical protein
LAIDMEKWLSGKLRRIVDNGEEHVTMAGPVPAE